MKALAGFLYFLGILAVTVSIPIPAFGQQVILQQQQQQVSRDSGFLSGLFNPFGRGKSFTCHGPDATSSLREVAERLTGLFRDYRDQLLERKSAPIPKFDICVGGWNDGSVNKPSIFVNGMDKLQVKRLIELIENQMKPAFDGIHLRRSGDNGLVVTRAHGISRSERKVIY